MHSPPKSKDHLKTKTRETTRRCTNLEQWAKVPRQASLALDKQMSLDRGDEAWLL